MSASTGSLLVSIAILLRWYDRSPGISARPLEFEETGKLSFLLSADGNIHQTREDRDALLTDGSR